MKSVKFLAVCLLLLFPVMNSGCFWLVAGGAAGYGVSPDSAEQSFDTSFSRAYRESLVVLREWGDTTMEDERGGWVKAEYDNYQVAAHITQKTAGSVEIAVSARKYATPRPKTAQEILNRIAKLLR